MCYVDVSAEMFRCFCHTAARENYSIDMERAKFHIGEISDQSHLSIQTLLFMHNGKRGLKLVVKRADRL